MTTRATSHEPRAAVADLTERELVARIQRRLPQPPDWLLVGIGDDAAVVEPMRQRVEVLTVDALVEGVHFDRAFVPPDAIGHRALAVNLSDLAAMGASPRLALLSMVLPASLPVADFDALVEGFARLAAEHRMHVVGGNLARSPGPMMIDVTVIGTAKRRQVLTRAGARAGDELYVSGTMGAAAGGLRLLRGNSELRSANVEPESRPGSELSVLSSQFSVLTSKFLRPEPRVRLGQLIGRNRAASACVDLSDGLADGLQRIAEASGVGMIVDASALPIDPATRAIFEAAGVDAIDESMSADDYELLVAVRPRSRRRFAAAVRQAGATMTKIGVCTEDRAIVLVRGDGSDGAAASETPVPAGYSHFR